MTADLYAALDEGQRAAVLAPAGPVCVLAGAGTGKTRTITHRIGHLIAAGHHGGDEILAVTFTTRAAGEMRTRLRSLGAGTVQARTFHSAALRQLAFFWPRVVGGEMWPVIEHKMRLVAAVAKRVGAGTDTPTLRDLASEIEWAKACLIAPDDYLRAVGALQRATPVDAQTVARAYSAYESAKTDARQLDFDDLLLHICAILENDEDAARTFRARYRCFVVDEYQDVTPLQQRTLDAWLGGRDQVTVVGDANQTIYSFAGASPRYLLDFERRYPHATVLRLERDYRSTPQVVTLANRVIAGASGATATKRLTLKAARPDGPDATFEEHPDEPAEAAAVARRAKELIAGGMSASSIAVLYRINAQSEGYEQALAAEGVPYVVRGGERFFTRADVRAALAELNKAARAEAARASAAGGSDGGAGESGAPDAAALGGETGLVPQVRAVLGLVGLTPTPPPPGALRDRWDALAALVSVAEELSAVDASATMTTFVAELAQRAQSQHAPSVDGVTLASLHAAKGLEWDAVFLVGLTDGTLPIQHADTPEAIEEERRLFYVGITRARSRLMLSWALARQEGGRRVRSRSRFLTGLVPSSGVPGTRRQNRRPGRCAGCGGPLTTAAEIKAGRCQNCPSTADPGLVAELKAWRKGRAADASVPAFVVFSDATLMAIAERRPSDGAALLAIPGIGRSKLDTYGSEVIAIVAGHTAEGTRSGGED
ncbi:MAG: ATP-dependent DNA helicase [Actinobacteria bacterium 69-20]|mgnify:CR=1 FL=1|jgi:DNA helicase-2/ATP-dependent DNA helicase PcrA|nr:ATP-dependent DNA helicase UvrD2 [Actinomycetota bacterium]OJV31270.1 MAG: ATP-dependent DNA helicase [Actinobacteria bacterium 69-20]